MSPRFDIGTLSWRAGEIARLVPARHLFGWLTRVVTVPTGWAALALRAGLDPLLVSAGDKLEKEALENALFVRTGPLECTAEHNEIASADGYACRGTIRLPLRVVLDHAELAALRRTLLGPLDLLVSARLQNHVEWPLRQVLAELSARHTATELLNPLDSSAVQPLVDEKLAPLCLAAGLKIDGPAQVHFDSPAYREHLRKTADVDAQRQQVAAKAQIQQALAAAQRERLTHLTELLERMRELSSELGPTSLMELLRRFDAPERSEMYAALWQLCPPQTRTRFAVALSGQELLLFNPAGLERPTHRIRLSEEHGPLRSVSADTWGPVQPDVDWAAPSSLGAGLLLVGAATAVHVVDPDSGQTRAILPTDGDPKLVRGGFNAAAMDEEYIFATHSELGLLLWDRKATGEKGVRNLLPERPEGCFAQKVPDPFFTPLCRQITRRAQTVRSVRVAGDRVWFAVDDTVWSARIADREATDLVPYRGADAAITALTVANGTVYAGTSAGRILAWPIRDPDAAQVIRQVSGTPVESLQIVETAGIRRLIFADAGSGATAMVLGDNYTCRYESPLRMRRVAAAGDLLLAMNDARDRLVAWQPHRPAEPLATIIIPHLTGSSIQDICLIPG